MTVKAVTCLPLKECAHCIFNADILSTLVDSILSFLSFFSFVFCARFVLFSSGSFTFLNWPLCADFLAIIYLFNLMRNSGKKLESVSFAIDCDWLWCRFEMISLEILRTKAFRKMICDNRTIH